MYNSQYIKTIPNTPTATKIQTRAKQAKEQITSAAKLPHAKVSEANTNKETATASKGAVP